MPTFRALAKKREDVERQASVAGAIAEGRDPLAEAVTRRDIFQVQALLRDRADPNSRGSAGQPLVFEAAMSGEPDLLVLLLSFSADPLVDDLLSFADSRGETVGYSALSLCDLFERREADEEELRERFAGLDPGALAQARKCLKLPGPFELGGKAPLSCLAEPSRVIACKPSPFHDIALHFADDTLRPALSLMPTRCTPTALVVFLHGIFQSGPMLRQVACDFAQAVPHARILLPTAPTRRSWLTGPAWFNFMADERECASEMNEVRDELLDLLAWQSQEAGLGPDRVVLAGFSMGGILAAWTALGLPCRLAGLLLFGTDSIKKFPATLEAMLGGAPAAGGVSEDGAGLPVLQCHGLDDRLCTVDSARDGVAMLRELGCNVVLSEHEGVGHALCPEMLREARAFLARQLPPSMSPA